MSFINVKIIETGELKTLPEPAALRWKMRSGKMRWNPVLYCYEMTQRQYDLECRMLKYQKIIGIICAIVVIGAIILAFLEK